MFRNLTPEQIRIAIEPQFVDTKTILKWEELKADKRLRQHMQWTRLSGTDEPLIGSLSVSESVEQVEPRNLLVADPTLAPQ